jgi:hypothetical protein
MMEAQTTHNSQLNAAAAMVAETATMTAMMTTMKTKVTLAAVAALRQCGSGRGGNAASAAAQQQQQQQQQPGGGGGTAQQGRWQWWQGQHQLWRKRWHLT